MRNKTSSAAQPKAIKIEERFSAAKASTLSWSPIPPEIWATMSYAERQEHKIKTGKLIGNLLLIQYKRQLWFTSMISWVWIPPSLWVRMKAWAKIRYFCRQEWYFEFLLGVVKPHYLSLLTPKRVIWPINRTDAFAAKKWIEPRVWNNMPSKARQAAKAPIFDKYRKIILLALIRRLMQLLWSNMSFDEQRARLLFTTRDDLVRHCLRVIAEFLRNRSLEGSLLSANEWARMTDWQKKRYLKAETNLEQRLWSVKTHNKKLKSAAPLKNRENRRRK
jgi:hypothetical protein